MIQKIKKLMQKHENKKIWTSGLERASVRQLAKKKKGKRAVDWGEQV
jgi:hypothetical protein